MQHPEVERYITEVGQRIISVMGPQPFEYRFFAVEDPQLNAFAVPGGSIYVHTGLMDRIRRTDELAGVLAHEIVHVKSRHIARLSGFDPAGLLALLGAFLGRGGPQGSAAAVLGQALGVTRQLSFTRQLEQEADTLGVKYMAAAGYDPTAALDFLKIIDRERVLNPVDMPPYLMTHPLTQDRVAGVEAAIRSFRLDPGRLEQQTDPLKRVQVILRLERHDADAVITEYQTALNHNPAGATPIHFLGLAYHYKGLLAQARQNYERARALDPKGAGIDRDLGRLYSQTGEFQLAHEAFERLLKAEPAEPLNYVLLGDLLEQQSRPQEAAAAYLRAQQLSPSWAVPPQRLSVVYGKMNRLGDAYYYLARSHLLVDEDERAIVDLERALKNTGEQSPRGQVIKAELEAIKARKR